VEYIGRVVVVLSPIVLGLAAWFSAWAAENFPGAPQIDSEQLGQIAVAGVLAAGAAIYKWLDNRGQQELADPNVVVKKP
jgi:hypothetical protein